MFEKKRFISFCLILIFLQKKIGFDMYEFLKAYFCLNTP